MRGERNLLVPDRLLVPPFLAMIESILPPLSLLYHFLLLPVRVYLRLLPFTAGVLYFLILDILRFKVSLFGPVLGELLVLFWSWSILFSHVWIS